MITLFSLFQYTRFLFLLSVMTKTLKIILNNRKDSRHSCFIPGVNGNVSIGIFTINNDISCECKIFFNVLRDYSSFIRNKKIGLSEICQA